MTIEKGVAIETATEALYAIKARLIKLEEAASSIDPAILGEINEFHIKIVRVVRGLSTKTINEIEEIKIAFENKYNEFERLLGG